MPGQNGARHLAFAFAVVVTALTVAACLTPNPTATPVPTQTPTPRPTFTNTVLPTATATRTATITSTPTPAITATPTTNPNLNPLTGLAVSNPALLQRRPVQVCIDNQPEVRPQFGLDRADIVYEYLMENYYNTRFTAMYFGQDADRIGPVRSARLVNLQLAPMYDAALACSGASDRTRWELKDNKKIYDYIYLDTGIDDPGINRYFAAYGRSRAQNTILLQTSTTAVHQWLKDIGKEGQVAIKGFTFSTEKPSAIAATTITIPYTADCCSVTWTYDPASGRYLRTMNGEPHVDGVTKEQLGAVNVIVVYAEHRPTNIVEDQLGGTAIDIVLTGEGKASLFRDGVAIAALWRRSAIGVPLQIVDATGKPVPLHPGNTWVEIAPDINFEATFK